MRPEKLTLSNFGPFAGTVEIDFRLMDDIFLITGKTGSGKTTIFDAVCFALYGAVPGSRRSYVSRLRSDYTPEAACSVSLDFSLGERRYRILRSPKYEKPKSRGSGTVTVDESAELYEITGDPIRALGSKRSEINLKIRELIGLEAEEFFKIVLLPQGEFAEFLKQNTTERREVLGKLFPVHRAIRARELVQEKAREAAAAAREAERTLGEAAKRVSFDTYETLHGEAEEAVKKAKTRAADLALRAARLQELLSLAETERRNLERLEAIRGEAAALEAAGEEIAEKERCLALSRQAQPLRHHLILTEETRRRLEQAGTELEGLLREKSGIRKRAGAAESQKDAIPALEKKLQGLPERRPALVEKYAEEEEIRRGLAEIERYKAALLGAEEKNRLLTGVLEEKNREIAQYQDLAGRAGEFDTQWEQARDIKDRLVQLRRLAGEAEEIAGEAEAVRARIADLDIRCAELERRVPILAEEFSALEREREAAKRADMAAHLAGELKPGEACPVCGSRTHPGPAEAKRPLFGLDERIESLGLSLKDAERDLAIHRTDRRAKTREAAQLEERSAAAVEQCRRIKTPPFPLEDAALTELFARDPPPEAAVSRALEDQVTRLNAVVSRRDEARRAGTRIPDLYRERDELLARRGEAEKTALTMTEKIKALEETIGELRRKHILLFGGTAAGAEDALEDLDKAIGETETLIRKYREEWESADRELAAAIAREESGRVKLHEAEEHYREAAAALSGALSASPFANPGELKRAMLDGDTETGLEREIARWKEDRSRTNLLTAELEQNLERIRAEQAAVGPSPGTEEINATLEHLRAEQERAAAERDQAAAALSSLEQDGALLREAARRYEELAQRAGQLNGLADDLSGKNPKKKAFDSWLLGLYLAEVAAFATRRLERMSESRYSLLLDSEGEAVRGRTGLDLAVFDAYTGKTRPCATLSGGESFMASISLALGLADSIQSRSGGVRLDAVFIDEGFGSLDEGSLDKALLILDELRDHRMVGLISHVNEMRSRIPSRIEVIKSGSGSKIAIEKGQTGAMDYL
ncbi:MAG: AAA family ATPase [Spirochaetaceae bacterium]|jgi:exonuclease SbcC|nr:AAA family ATPase [Spirochaetaceae bacterium]